MDMIDSMTMPELLVAALVVLAVVGAGLFLFVRIAGERQVNADRDPSVARRRRREKAAGDPGDPKA